MISTIRCVPYIAFEAQTTRLRPMRNLATRGCERHLHRVKRDAKTNLSSADCMAVLPWGSLGGMELTA
jgi:hypothetical protein